MTLFFLFPSLKSCWNMILEYDFVFFDESNYENIHFTINYFCF